MKRATRVQIAEDTVSIIQRGSYVAPDGLPVDVSAAIQACLLTTRYFRSDEMEPMRQATLATPTNPCTTAFEVVNETTLVGIARLTSEGAHPLAALNFASAKNPGGGFLNGSQAQEESLARSSALYGSLRREPDFYESHRAMTSLLYSDAMILSPHCPNFRDDTGALLSTPHQATFITSPAPNAGATADNHPHESPMIPEVLHRRAEYVLALAASQGYRNLVLGAWGCGVFRNDPKIVAAAFHAHLIHGAWAGRFDRVVFSVLDISESKETFQAFFEAFSR